MPMSSFHLYEPEEMLEFIPQQFVDREKVPSAAGLARAELGLTAAHWCAEGFQDRCIRNPTAWIQLRACT